MSTVSGGSNIGKGTVARVVEEVEEGVLSDEPVGRGAIAADLSNKQGFGIVTIEFIGFSVGSAEGVAGIGIGERYGNPGVVPSIPIATFEFVPISNSVVVGPIDE